MSSLADFDVDIDARLREGIDGDYRDSGRIQSVLTSSIPSRFSGRFVVWVAERAPEAIDSRTLLNAAVAVQYADLHRYLHAIPGADGALIPPADASAYAAEPRTAILDGDYVQSRAFARIADLGQDARTRLACYRLLARGSIDRYRHAHAERPQDAVADFLGHVAGIGAVLGGSTQETRERVERVAAEIGSIVPITTPTERADWSDEITDEVRGGLRHLESLLPVDPANPRIESPIEEH